MQAIVVQEKLSEHPLVWQEVPDPSYGPDDALVNVHATALNRTDLLQAAGECPAPPGASEILGLEMSGIVAAKGKNVVGWQVGNRVRAPLAGGGYAEQVVVPARLLIAIPKDRDFHWGAALPHSILTAYLNLFIEASLKPGETVLIHGGTSGVGTYGIQLARLAGCRVLATAGSDAKLETCRLLGAEMAVNYKDEDFSARILSHLDGTKISVVMDMVGVAYLEQTLGLLETDGRLVIISDLSGRENPVQLRGLMLPSQRLFGSALRLRSIEEKASIIASFKRQYLANLHRGSLRPVIDSIYPITEANAAHAHMAKNRNTGKIVLQVRG